MCMLAAVQTIAFSTSKWKVPWLAVLSLSWFPASQKKVLLQKCFLDLSWESREWKLNDGMSEGSSCCLRDSFCKFLASQGGMMLTKHPLPEETSTFDLISNLSWCLGSWHVLTSGVHAWANSGCELLVWAFCISKLRKVVATWPSLVKVDWMPRQISLPGTELPKTCA